MAEELVGIIVEVSAEVVAQAAVEIGVEGTAEVTAEAAIARLPTEIPTGKEKSQHLNKQVLARFRWLVSKRNLQFTNQ